jgi:hypothetical protein
MAVVSTKKANVIRKQAQERYDKKGFHSVYDLGNKRNLEQKYCKGCETHTPSLQTITTEECLLCGQ